MKRVIVPLLSLIIISTSSCSSLRINSFKDSDFNLGNYSTFNFYEIDVLGLSKKLESINASEAEYDRQIGWIKEALNNELNECGLEQSAERPELKINIGIFLKEIITTRESRFPQDAPVYIGQRNYSWKSEVIEVGRYTEGTILIELVEQELGELVWMGYVSGETVRDEIKAKRKLAEAIDKLFNK